MRGINMDYSGAGTNMIKKLALSVLSLTLFTATTAFAYDVQILSAVVKDQVIPDASIILQKNGESSVQTVTATNVKASFNSPFNISVTILCC